MDSLSPEERDKLKAHLSGRQDQKPARPRTVDEWVTELEDIAREFRGNFSEEEMKAIIASMTMKSKPSEKGL